jgi:recombination protein RecR
MKPSHLNSIQRLKDALKKLPGVGDRGAERLAFHILREDVTAAKELAGAILAVKEDIFHCGTCFNLTEQDPCAICSDPSRDGGELWVVEQPKDLLALESTGIVKGVYHVLMGHIAPLEGVEPGDLTIDALVRRVRGGGIREVILATNPTLEGDGTALHIQSVLADLEIKISRPSRGLAVGSPLEFASSAMLEAAIRGRTLMS